MGEFALGQECILKHHADGFEIKFSGQIEHGEIFVVELAERFLGGEFLAFINAETRVGVGEFLVSALAMGFEIAYATTPPALSSR